MGERDRHAKVRLFREIFCGLEHVYGTYDPRSGRSWQVKAPVTDGVVLDHLSGKRPYGAYLLMGNRTRAVVADFDHDDANPPRDFVSTAAHYGIPSYVERSKSKGYHAWVFLDEKGVLAAKARLVVRHILDEIDAPNTEVFPKQVALQPDSTNCGNFINTPLFGRLVPRGRTVFVQSDGAMETYPDQWDFLKAIERVPEDVLDEITEVNGLVAGRDPPHGNSVSLGVFQLPLALPPCARRMLDEGVSTRQRVSCFRLAVQLRRIGLPFDVVVGALSAWATKNRPVGGKRIITPVEIKAQTAAAFLKEYRGCGCEDPAVSIFCDPSCPVKRDRRCLVQDNG